MTNTISMLSYYCNYIACTRNVRYSKLFSNNITCTITNQLSCHPEQFFGTILRLLTFLFIIVSKKKNLFL